MNPMPEPYDEELIDEEEYNGAISCGFTLPYDMEEDDYFVEDEED